MNIIDIPKSVLELLDLRLNSTEPWPDPQELEITLEPVLPFDPELLPEVLRDFVFDNATRMQGPPDFVTVACLVAIGSVIGTSCAVRPKQHDDWYEYPNLWGGIVGGPSMMKTPLMSTGIQAIAWLELDAGEAYKTEIARYQSDKLDREYELKQLNSPKASTKLRMDDEQIRARIRELTAAPPQEPKRRRYKTNDSTAEMLGELIRDNPRGLLVIRDELIGLLANCNRQGHEGDRSFYL